MAAPDHGAGAGGQIDAGWLAGGDHENPWRLVSRERRGGPARDAFLGNGCFGQRVGPDGQAGNGRWSGCYVHGLWGEDSLIAPPRWCTLQYHDGDASHASGAGEHLEYEQCLHMDEARLVTRELWRSGRRETRMRTELLLSRANRHLAVLTVTIEPGFSGTVAFEDALDGTGVEQGVDWRAGGSTAATALSVTLGPRRRRTALASRVMLSSRRSDALVGGGGEGCAAHGGRHGRLASEDAGAAESLHSTIHAAAEEVRAAPDGRCVARTIRFPVQPGQAYTLTKLVAVVTDADADDPAAEAQRIVSAVADPGAERAAHVEAWRTLWRGRIDLEGRWPRLQALINAALYQLYSQLRPEVPWSLGPTGITSGAWGGRVFWDADLWVFPVVALLNPSLAKAIVRYRANTLDGARGSARDEGYAGALFAWESAESGVEKIPRQHYPVHDQRHVNSDVALAQWQYVLLSGDEAYFRDHAAEVILESARFWESRVAHNGEHGRYELPGMFCADEWAGIRDNNAFTNASAAATLRRGVEVCRRLGRPAPESWTRIADGLYLPFDARRRHYVEYDGYDGRTIKQADTVLMIYPYEVEMPDDVMRSTADYYRTKYPPDKIMMGSAIDGIIDAQLGRPGGAWGALLDLLPHFHRPFLLASEAPSNDCISFATGLGGFLQLLAMGFAGVRMHDDGLLVSPCLPDELPALTLRGVHYAGVSFDLRIADGGRQVVAEGFSGPAPFRLYDRQGRDIPRR